MEVNFGRNAWCVVSEQHLEIFWAPWSFCSHWFLLSDWAVLEVNTCRVYMKAVATWRFVSPEAFTDLCVQVRPASWRGHRKPRTLHAVSRVNGDDEGPQMFNHLRPASIASKTQITKEKKTWPSQTSNKRELRFRITGVLPPILSFVFQQYSFRGLFFGFCTRSSCHGDGGYPLFSCAAHLRWLAFCSGPINKLSLVETMPAILRASRC